MSIEWRNWSGSQQHQAKQLSLPESEAELLSLLDHARNEDLVVRPIGSAHSFVPFWTDDILLSLDNMKGIRHIDSERQQVTMWAGTKLHEIGQPLFEAGFAMTNMGSPVNRRGDRYGHPWHRKKSAKYFQSIGLGSGHAGEW
jgi:FAD/FMN-containing dehydrogenase